MALLNESNGTNSFILIANDEFIIISSHLNQIIFILQIPHQSRHSIIITIEYFFKFFKRKNERNGRYKWKSTLAIEFFYKEIKKFKNVAKFIINIYLR